MNKWLIIPGLMLPLLIIPGITLAEYDNINHLMVQFKQKLQDKKRYNLAITQGKYRAELCQHCHGIDGNSLRNYIPNLAAQNAQYLLTQFEFFRLGKRKDYVMGNIAKTISEEDRVNLALYYSSQRVNTKFTSRSVSTGKRVFNKVCVSCHGKQGHGNKDLPRIAGQPEEFIAKTLTAYRNNNHRRPDSPMLGIAAMLSREDIKTLANYISTMN